MAGLGLFYIFPSYYSFVILIFLWWALTVLIGIKLSIGIDNIILHLAASSGFFALLSITEWLPAKLLVLLLCGAVFAILWLWPAIGQKNPMQFMQKPWRRIIMMVWVLAAYAWFSGLSALAIFYPDFPMIILCAAEGLLGGFFAFMILRLYSPGRKFSDCWIGISATALATAETGAAISFSPFGYFILGLIIAWIWYIIQLFLRFHTSPEGIIWRKQAWFLAGNALLFAAMLYFTRWI